MAMATASFATASSSRSGSSSLASLPVRHHPARTVRVCGRLQELRRRALIIGSSSVWPSLAVFGAVAAGAVTLASMASAGKPLEASVAIRRGMQLFTQGDVEGSMVEFDKALAVDPSKRPYLWQRGLSLYYLDRFQEGATQFREDVAVNPNDTEEAIWCYLCEAQLYGVEEARKIFLVVGRDSRPVMRKAYELFRDGGNPQDLMAEGNDMGGPNFFYASLYTGLYHEAEKQPEAAKSAIVAACNSPYALRSGDYMASLARVHCQCRGWEI